MATQTVPATPPAGALTTAFRPTPRYCETGESRFSTRDCMPPNWSAYWDGDVGYYSPGICPHSYTSAATRTSFDAGPAVQLWETAIICCPRFVSLNCQTLRRPVAEMEAVDTQLAASSHTATPGSMIRPLQSPARLRPGPKHMRFRSAGRRLTSQTSRPILSGQVESQPTPGTARQVQLHPLGLRLVELPLQAQSLLPHKARVLAKAHWLASLSLSPLSCWRC